MYFENKFDSKEFNWRAIYTSPQKVTTNTYLRYHTPYSYSVFIRYHKPYLVFE